MKWPRRWEAGEAVAQRRISAYDIPDFHNEEDLKKYENDHLTPFYGSDGSTPTIAPSLSTVNFTPEDMSRYDATLAEIDPSK